MNKNPADIRTFTIFSLCLFGSLSIFSLWIADIYYAQGNSIPAYKVAVGRDFANLWIGGKHVWNGSLDHLYDLPDYLKFMRGYFPDQVQHNYSYPPFTLFIGSAFSLLPYLMAYLLWIGITAFLFLKAAGNYVRNLPIVFALLTPGAIATMWDGQYGFLVGALWLFMFARIERAPKQAGLLAGLLTIKPHFGILIPPILFLRRKFTTIIFAVLMTITLVLISVAVFGMQLWSDYLIKASAAQADVLLTAKDNGYFNMMPTTLVAFRYLPHFVGVTAQCLTSIIALALLWKARLAPMKELAFIAATANFLILPYAFNYDMTVLCLGLIVVLSDRWKDMAFWERMMLSAGVMLPTLVLLFGKYHLPITPAILIGCLFIQVRWSTRVSSQDKDASLLSGDASWHLNLSTRPMTEGHVHPLRQQKIG